MLYKRRHEDVCVLTVSTAVFAINQVVITDRNAASDCVRFLSPSQWSVLEFDDIFALDWRHPDDPYRYYRHKSRKCAEVLVPNRVPPHMITGAYVPDAAARGGLQQTGFALPIVVVPDFFFR